MEYHETTRKLYKFAADNCNNPYACFRMDELYNQHSLFREDGLYDVAPSRIFVKEDVDYDYLSFGGDLAAGYGY